ncbi:MAG TPA: XRE family transcriptional regulator [Lachnospiraceae bacterium]|nr:XRE family transcriptional regulator [Lachnospiraceae bacterium]
MNYTKLGNRIREERLRLNLTQEKLAESANITTAYLGQIERGERGVRLDKLIVIAQTLGVTIDFLLKDYVSSSDDLYIDQIRQLFYEMNNHDKELAVNIIKLLFSYSHSE